jgi:hypothetical protein
MRIESFVNGPRVDLGALEFGLPAVPIACAATAATATEAAVQAAGKGFGFGKGFGWTAFAGAAAAGAFVATFFHGGSHYTSAAAEMPNGGVPGMELSSADLLELAAGVHA